MKLVFFTNYVHHHQVPLADEFYKLLEGHYQYVAMESLPDWLIRGGYDPTIDRPYIVKAYESENEHQYALRLANEADVVIIGSAPEECVAQRIKEGKITFRYSERWFKSRPWYFSGPIAWYNYYRHHIRYKHKPLYMLAASAFTCRDVNTVGAYQNKVYKWGYFTGIEEFQIEILTKLDISNVEQIPRIMWCSRFLKWKHPELPILLAKRLKNKGYRFQLNMYGSGDELKHTILLATRLNVLDVVSFCGNLPNNEILIKMREHEIFLFTSDRNEGWGAVLNESMSNGCAVVASDLIGAVPFLIDDGINGLIFKSKDLDSLEDKVVFLLKNPALRIQMAQNAIKTMRKIWSPQNAARQFMSLVEALRSNNESLLPVSGPCSKAERI